MKRWLGSGQLAAGKRVAGYTITEVMIVLAVTTVFFVVIAMTFQGRQARAEFNQAVRGFEAKLQNTISEVSNGTFQTEPCVAAPNTGPPQLGGTDVKGTCVFLGKAYQPDHTRSDILTLIGRRTFGSPPAGPYEVVSLEQAEPVVSDSREDYGHGFQLDVLRIISLADGVTEINTFGFMMPLAGGFSVQTDQSAGSRQVTLFGVADPEVFETSGLVDTDAYVPLPDGIVVCLQGQNGQRAEVRIGERNNNAMIFSELDTGADNGECRNA